MNQNGKKLFVFNNYLVFDNVEPMILLCTHYTQKLSILLYSNFLMAVEPWVKCGGSKLFFALCYFAF